MNKTLRLFYITSVIIRGRGQGLSSRAKGILIVKKTWWRGAVWYCLFLGGLFVWISSFLIPSVITVAAVTVWLLISLLFPVKCYFKPWSLTFAPPVLNLILSQWEGGGENWEARVAHGLGSVSGGTEWGTTIPKPSHEQRRKKKPYFQLAMKALGFSIHFLLLKYFGTPMMAPKCHSPASTSIAPVQELHCPVVSV